MKIYNFQGELTDISAKKEELLSDAGAPYASPIKRVYAWHIPY